MLVLTRYPDESILIGDDVEIRVAEVRGESIHVRIATAKNVPAVREQVLRPDQPILIGDGIKVVLVEVRGSKVRLGIAAPDNCRIRRDELR